MIKSNRTNSKACIFSFQAITLKLSIKSKCRVYTGLNSLISIEKAFVHLFFQHISTLRVLLLRQEKGWGANAEKGENKLLCVTVTC